MIVKGRSPALGHVPRTHRVDLDWLFERCQYDPAIMIRFVPTKDQLADMLTKGSFAALQWQQQLKLWEIGQSSQVSHVQPEKECGKNSSKQQKLKRHAAACWSHCQQAPAQHHCPEVPTIAKQTFYPTSTVTIPSPPVHATSRHNHKHISNPLGFLQFHMNPNLYFVCPSDFFFLI